MVFKCTKLDKLEKLNKKGIGPLPLCASTMNGGFICKASTAITRP